MAEIVEDGTVVPGANTYRTIANIVAYAAERGVTITTEQATIYSQQAMDYLETRNYGGSLVEDDQSLQMPRDYIYINGVEQTHAQLAQRMGNAQSEYVVGLSQGFDLLENPSQSIKEESSPVGKIVYQDGSSSGVSLTKMNMWLDPLLDYPTSSAFHFSTERSYG